MDGPEREKVERFREAIARRLGLEFEDAKLSYLADLLRERAKETANRNVAGYLSSFETVPGERELRALAEELTVSETYFFRNPTTSGPSRKSPFRAVSSVIRTLA